MQPSNQGSLMDRRQFLKKASLSLCASAALPLFTSCFSTARKPNMLFVISDDQSWPYAGAYGCPFVNTPAFDRVAKTGVLFNNAFCAAPQCSPNRASILTGRHIWQNEEAGTHASLFPKKLDVFTDELEKVGYKIGYTGKPWGPGNWEQAGWTRNPAGPEYNEIAYDQPPRKGIRNLNYAANFEAFLNEKSDHEPFFFWYGASEPHREYQKGSGLEMGKELEDVEVPGFLPDHPEIRSDLLDYAVEIEWFDQHLGKMIDLLEKRGELDNTLIVVTSDNGMPFPRAKANLYEYGIHVPLAVCWPDKVKANRIVDDLIGFVDFAPTFLEAGQARFPAGMSGKSFLNVLLSGKSGTVDETRRWILAGRERHTHARPDNLSYPSRVVRTEDFLFIWNMKSDRWPAGDPTGSGEPEGYHDIDGCPSKTFLLENRDQYPELAALSLDKRPEEELYDIQSDPYCLVNLADRDDYRTVKEEMRQTLEQILREQKDPRVQGSEIFESYPRFSRMRNFPGFKEMGAYNPAYR